MIKIDALYFLLLIELLVVLAVTGATLFLRLKKLRILHEANLEKLDNADSSLEALQNQQSEQQASASPGQAAPKIVAVMDPGITMETKELVETKEQEELKTKVTALEEQLQEKDKRIAALETKYGDLEKEYMVLYQQQQQNQQPL